MRRQHHVLHREQRRRHLRLVLVDVEPHARDALLQQCLGKRRLVDHRTARGVDDEGGLLHQPQFALAQQVPRVGNELRMQRDEIGLAQQVVVGRVDHTVFGFVGFRQPARVAVEDAHAEAVGAPRHRLADAAGADQTDRLAAHRRAGEMVRLRSRIDPGAEQLVAFDNAPRHRQQQAEADVGGGIGDDGRNVGDRDLALGRGGDVDLVGRDHHGVDGAQVRIGGDHIGVDAVVQQRHQDVVARDARAQVGLGDDLARVGIDLDIGDRAQTRKRALRNRLRDENFRLAHLLITAFTLGRTFSASKTIERRPRSRSFQSLPA